MQAILTLRTSGDYSGHDLRRANMLIASLDRFWMGTEPLHLTVIARDEDLNDISTNLRTERTRLTIVPETDVLPCLKALPSVPGWNKQQALKLAAHRLVTTPFYLILDADIVCCQPFSSSSLIIDGKCLADWESRSRHPQWWEGSAIVLRQPPEHDKMGLSVTPEILAVDICAKLAAAITAIHQMDCWEYLLTYRFWTEFSLYSMFAMRDDLMMQYHHSASWMKDAGKALRVDNNIWGPADYPIWKPEASLQPGARGTFMVCQSNADIDPATLRARLGPIFERALPQT